MDNKKWFKEAQFGMMIHFGLYSMLGGEWKGQCMDQIAEWAQSYFRIPNKEYHALAKAFNPMFFDAEEWVKVAKDAGMKYFVITSKHHDGFALFKSDASKFNVVDATPFGRDIIADWDHPDGSGTQEFSNFGMSWENDWDYPNIANKDYKRCYTEKIKPQVKEILTNYGDLCLIWFDTPMGMPQECSKELYEMVKQYQPNCLINSRLGHGKCDYESAGDNEIPEDYKGDRLFETPATLNDTWGFKPADQNWKSADEVIRLKNHLKERGANYLLNVGPDGLGRFPAKAIEILQEVGKKS